MKEMNAMKTISKRLLSLLMVLALLCTLAPAVLADDTEYEGPSVVVYFALGSTLLQVGDKTTVSAVVEDADPGATYDWRCSDESVVRIEGAKDSVRLTAVGIGEAVVSLTVTNSNGSNSFDFFSVEVENPFSPIRVSGGGNVSMEAGDTKKLSASVSGGSGSYVFEWETTGSAQLEIIDELRQNAEIYAGSGGSGTVILTVYDAEDYSNNDTAFWDVSVKSSKLVTPPTVFLSRGSVDIGAGGTASLSLEIEGGSGRYDYYWKSDNSRVVSLYDYGDTADIYATGTLIPGAKNSAEISVYVRDKESGLTSNTATCTVFVSGGSTYYNAYDNLKVGDYFSMSGLASEISAMALIDLGSSISYSASVKFSNPNTRVGSLRLQDGTAVRSGASYTFASFQDMYFYGDAAGSFETEYLIVDGGNTIGGVISLGIEASGATVRDAELSSYDIEMSTYSSEYLSMGISPKNASCTIDWSVKNSSIVSISGSGSKITLKSGGKIGTTQVIATVYDANGFATTCACNVTVYDDSATYYSPSVTIMLGSDYYGTQLADNMASKFKDEYGVYLGENATIVFDALGKSTYGAMYLSNGKPVKTNVSYTFRDWIDMYFTPYAKGTYSIGYTLSYRGNSLHGEIKVIVDVSNINVQLDKSTVKMTPYSSQNLMLDVSPATARYWVNWISSDTRVVTVAGSNATAVLNSIAPGTATVTAVVTDSYGVEIRRSCTVTVDGNSSAFNPSVSTTIGIPYIGTGTSTAMRAQFASLYNLTPDDNATIRFSSTGNNSVGVMRLEDGTPIKPNVDYTLKQYVAMYTDAVSAGTFSVPYALTYAGKTLSGTVSVVINAAEISTNLTLTTNAPYTFSEAIAGGTGATIFANSVSNAIGANWGYICFSSIANGAGVLYLDRYLKEIKPDTRITTETLSELYFMPTELNGTFSVPFTVYTLSGSALGKGTLNISRPTSSFTDVSSDAYYAKAVDWAVSKGITSGTGGSNFSPDMIVNRGQAVTFLWRAAGQPKITAASNPFTDVSAGSYYYDAVLWAVQQGITNGTTATTFSPDAPLHRDQLLTFLCRANGGTAGGADWSKQAVDWANARGLLAGIPGTFTAAGDCPRSDVVYYLWKNYTA